MSKHLVINVTRFDFVPEGKTNRIAGCKVSFLNSPVSEQNKKGSSVMTVTGDYLLYEQFHTLPAYYELELDYSEGKIWSGTKFIPGIVAKLKAVKTLEKQAV